MIRTIHIYSTVDYAIKLSAPLSLEAVDYVTKTIQILVANKVEHMCHLQRFGLIEYIFR